MLLRTVPICLFFYGIWVSEPTQAHTQRLKGDVHVAVLEGKDTEDTGGFKKWLKAAFGDAINSAASEQLHVLRGAMRTFNLMEKPGDFLKDNKIRWTILRYMLRGRAKNNRARFQRGPKREQMLAIAEPQQNQNAA